MIYDSLQAIADYMLSSFESKYTNLLEAKREVYYLNKKIIFDSTTFYIYYSDLDYNENIELKKFIKAKYVKKKEREKERKERLVLNEYLRRKGYESYTINKRIRPDFIVTNGKKTLGIEVTELKSKSIAVQDKICQATFGKNLSKDEVKAEGKKVTSTMYDYFEYDSINGHSVVASPLFDVGAHKKEFVETIEKKIEKYKDLVNKYDEFIILANAPDIEITSEYDIKDVLSKISLKVAEPIWICVLYDEDGRTPKIYETLLNKI